MVRCLFLALWVVLAGGAALADSDGHFCSGKDYFAYETSFSWPGKTHLLRVVRFGSGVGFVESPPVKLEEFQTHGMRCGETEVELQGWEFLYLVEVSNPAAPRLVRREPLPRKGMALPGFRSANLAYWGRSGVYELESSDPTSQFALVIAKASLRLPRGMETYTISELVQRSRTGPDDIRASLRLYIGVNFEAAD